MIGFSWLKDKMTMYQFRKQWKKKNSHNFTYPIAYYPIDWITIGNNTYGPIDVLFSNNVNKLRIGNYCSIGGNVKFLVSGDHALDRISTYPFKTRCLTGELEGLSKGDIIVDDDVWIGYSATILSGVHIGQGAVVAANSVVSKDVPPYSIVAGVPAKVIKYRFSANIIEKLMTIDYSKLDVDMLHKHVDELYQKLEVEQQLDWLPKKI